MCGIFGWITPGRKVDRARVAQATNRMRHRGPDDEGYLFASLSGGGCRLAAGDETSKGLRLPHWREDGGMEGADLAFGFRRLSIHDLSEAGHQPMGTPDGKLWIVFNGEVYNFIELRAELESRGVVFRSRTDTEVILRAYEAWGKDCLKRFNGMWGIAILDLRDPAGARVFFARDRVGVKPFYYAEDGRGGLVFASEMKAVLAALDGWEIDPIQVSNFLAWGRNPSPRAGDTMIRQVRMLPPGCRAEFHAGGLKVERWWDLPEQGDGDESDETESVERMRALLEDAVRLRLRADVPVGSCLSGGLDSSLIVGLVRDLLAGQPGASRQHTFSAVYDIEGPFNEKRFIGRVVDSLDTCGHYTVPDGDRLSNDFDRMIWHQEEPFDGTSIFAQWCVMDLAKSSGVTVLLDGQAADELFAGYRPWSRHFGEVLRREGLFQAMGAMRLASRETGDKVRKSFLSALLVEGLPESWVREGTRFGYGRALEKSAATILRQEHIGSLVGHVLDPGTPESYPWRRVTENLDEHLRGLVLDFCLPHLLRYEDRNSMAFSVEARVPFTDYRIVEKAFSPAMQGLKIHKGWPKWVLREAGQGLIPDDIRWRRDKMGFGTPEPRLVASLIHSRGTVIGEPLAQWIDPGMASAILREAASMDAPPKISRRAFRLHCLDSWLKQFGA